MTDEIGESEVTPRELYFNRRNFLRAGLMAGTVAGTAVLYRKLNGVELDASATPEIRDVIPAPAEYKVAGETLTPRVSIVNYNNFYEFTTNKDGVAAAAKNFVTDGWKISVEGMCHKPRVFDLDSFRKLSPPEERIYRHRCVEAWSMVVPWVGFSVNKLLAAVEPMGDAKYVAFETLMDPMRFPNQHNRAVLDWPYVEGLEMKEAMHPLAIFATGLYGQELPAQDGAPVKLVVPWKYGFKGIKSIVKITLTDKQPPTTWNKRAAREYGFYANVNPGHPHPRWSQATEQRIGESGRRKTLMFNGYGEQVASLYTGMDLDVLF
jgi:methionine sulfoxide reductase catalytic subunit